MKEKIRQAWKWIMAAIVLLIVLKMMLAVFGRPPVHGAHGHATGQGQFGHPHMMKRHAFMGGFPWIWMLAAVAFWSGAIMILYRWFKRKASTPLFQQSISFPSYTSPIKSADFLDEWEKDQMKAKEEQ